MKGISVIILLALSCSCTSFSKYSKFNSIQSCGGYICINNDSLNIKFTSFGAFKIANSKREFRNLKLKGNLEFKNIIFFGTSSTIETDYYLLLNNKKRKENFVYRDTIIDGRKITVAVKSAEKSAPSNQEFLLNGIRKLK